MLYYLAAFVLFTVYLFLHFMGIPFLLKRNYTREPYPSFRKITYLRIAHFLKYFMLFASISYLGFVLVLEGYFLDFSDASPRFDIKTVETVFGIQQFSEQFNLISSLFVLIGLLFGVSLWIYGHSHAQLMLSLHKQRLVFDKESLPALEPTASMRALAHTLDHTQADYFSIAQGYDSHHSDEEDLLLEKLQHVKHALDTLTYRQQSYVIGNRLQHQISYTALQSQLQGWSTFFKGRYGLPLHKSGFPLPYFLALFALLLSLFSVQVGMMGNYLEQKSAQLERDLPNKYHSQSVPLEEEYNQTEISLLYL